METPDPKEGLERLNGEGLLDLLAVRSRAAKAIAEQLDQLEGQIEQLRDQQNRQRREQGAAEQAVRAVLDRLVARAAE